MMSLHKGMEVSSLPIPWYTVNRGKCGDSGEERKFISCQEGNPGCPVHSAVTIWLSYHCFAKLAYTFVVDRRANAEISKTRGNTSLDVPILAHSRFIMIRNTASCVFRWPCISLQIIPNNQLDACFHVFIYFISLHVSSITVLIIRRSNCINTSSGMISMCKWLLGMSVRRLAYQAVTYTD